MGPAKGTVPTREDPHWWPQKRAPSCHTAPSNSWGGVQAQPGRALCPLGEPHSHCRVTLSCADLRRGWLWVRRLEGCSSSCGIDATVRPRDLQPLPADTQLGTMGKGGCSPSTALGPAFPSPRRTPGRHREPAQGGQAAWGLARARRTLIYAADTTTRPEKEVPHSATEENKGAGMEDSQPEHRKGEGSLRKTLQSRPQSWRLARPNAAPSSHESRPQTHI